MKSTRVGDDKYAQPKGGSGGAALFRVCFYADSFCAIFASDFFPSIMETNGFTTFLVLRNVLFFFYF